MKRFLAIFGVLVLTMTLAACSTPTASTPDAKDDKSKVMKETIHGQEVNFSQNDIVLIAGYDGQYADRLTPVTIDAGGGDTTITIAVFGDIVDVSLAAGIPHSEGGSLDLAYRLSSALLTITNAPNLQEYIVILNFMDVSGMRHSLSLGLEKDNDSGILLIADSGKRKAAVEPGHTLWATYLGEGYKLSVEVDAALTVQGQPKNFLYLQLDGEPKQLLTQSIDCGEGQAEWPHSVRNIIKPTLSSDGSKVYYETDAYNHGSGAGANNHFTHVVDVSTKEDSLLAVGGLHLLLSDEYHAPYGGYLILQGYESGADGRLVQNYFVVTPEGANYCFLADYVELYDFDLVDQIRNAAR